MFSVIQKGMAQRSCHIFISSYDRKTKTLTENITKDYIFHFEISLKGYTLKGEPQLDGIFPFF